VLFVDELIVEEVVPEWDGELEGHFGEGLAQADARPAQEGREGEGATLAAARLLIVVALHVEAVGDELSGLLPLFGVILNLVNHDVEGVALSEVNASHSRIFRHAACG